MRRCRWLYTLMLMQGTPMVAIAVMMVGGSEPADRWIALAAAAAAGALGGECLRELLTRAAH